MSGPIHDDWAEDEIDDECEPASNDQAFWFPDNDQSGAGGPENINLENLPPQEQLLAAAAQGNTDAAREALRRGAQINLGTGADSGDTALINAARMGQTAMVNFLLSHGADAEARNVHHKSAADEAGGKDHIVKLLDRGGRGVCTPASADIIEEEPELIEEKKVALSTQKAKALVRNEELSTEMRTFQAEIAPVLDGPSVLQKARRRPVLNAPSTPPAPGPLPVPKPAPKAAEPAPEATKPASDALTAIERRAARMAKQKAAAPVQKAAAPVKAPTAQVSRGRPGHDFKAVAKQQPVAKQKPRPVRPSVINPLTGSKKQLRTDSEPPARREKGLVSVSPSPPPKAAATPPSWQKAAPVPSVGPRQSHPLPRGLRRAAAPRAPVRNTTPAVGPRRRFRRGGGGGRREAVGRMSSVEQLKIAARRQVELARSCDGKQQGRHVQALGELVMEAAALSHDSNLAVQRGTVQALGELLLEGSMGGAGPKDAQRLSQRCAALEEELNAVRSLKGPDPRKIQAFKGKRNAAHGVAEQCRGALQLLEGRPSDKSAVSHCAQQLDHWIKQEASAAASLKQEATKDLGAADERLQEVQSQLVQLAAVLHRIVQWRTPDAELTASQSLELELVFLRWSSSPTGAGGMVELKGHGGVADLRQMNLRLPDSGSQAKLSRLDIREMSHLPSFPRWLAQKTKKVSDWIFQTKGSTTSELLEQNSAEYQQALQCLQPAEAFPEVRRIEALWHPAAALQYAWSAFNQIHSDGALEEQLLIGESGLAHPVQTESDEDGRPLELLQQPARFSQEITPTAGDRSVVVATVLTAQAAECAKPTGDGAPSRPYNSNLMVWTSNGNREYVVFEHTLWYPRFLVTFEDS